jgi:hypothetical protein
MLKDKAKITAAQTSDNFAAAAGRVILNFECIRFLREKKENQPRRNEEREVYFLGFLRVFRFFVVDFLMTSAC